MMRQQRSGVARASLEELLLDCEDFLRQKGLALWGKDQGAAKTIRQLAYASDRSYKSYRPILKNKNLRLLRTHWFA